MPADFDDLITIGYITKAHGVKGELSVQVYADSLDFFQGELLLEKQGNPKTRKTVATTSSRRHHGGLLLMFEGVKDRAHAEAYKGYSICVLRSELPEADEGEAYLADILGLKVFVAPNDEHDTPFFLGTIVAVDEPAGQELWTIETASGKEVLLPAVPEFVLDIDLDKEEVLISPPPGLLEIFLGK